MNVNFRYFVPAVLWTILIIILSSLPGGTIKEFTWESILKIDKMGHFGVYAIYVLTLLYGFYKNRFKESSVNDTIMALIIAFLLGLAMEFMQAEYFKDRHFDILDLIANIIGSIGGLIIFILLKKRRLWIFH